MNIKEVRQLIEEVDAIERVPLIESEHGVGKSTVCHDYAKDNNLHYEPLILSQMDTGDMLGIPNERIIGGQSTTVWSAPSWYTRILNAAWPTVLEVSALQFQDDDLAVSFQAINPTDTITREAFNEVYRQHYNLPEGALHILSQDNVYYTKGQRSVLFLDEFNRSPQDILNASLQLILDKRLNDHILPRVCGHATFIVSAINPSNGDYTVNEFDKALLDRFVTCSLDSDTPAWLDWARANNINSLVCDYIAENPTKLHTHAKQGKGSSSRSWTSVATYLDSIHNKPTNVTTYVLSGMIGQSLAAEMVSYIYNYSQSLTVEQIEDLVTKKAKRIKKIERLGEVLAKDVNKIEAIKRIELAKNLATKYGSITDPEEAKPYLAYLYALPLETLSAFLSEISKDKKSDVFKNLVALDKAANDKKLLLRVVEIAR